jgi:signal transduction histidine kinase
VCVAARTKELRSTYDEQAKFLADISHELQTPIAILRGNVEILERCAGAPEAHASVRVIAATLDSMARLVNSILEGARLKFSKDKFYKTDIAVRLLLEEVYEDCFVLSEDKGIRFSYASEEATVVGDREKLKEVLLNLISNALKYTARGGTIALLGRAAPGYAEIIIEDTGCGIPAENLPNIFERFYRIEGDAAVAGTGIGLHICQQIVEAHNGAITVESELGRGSRFTVRIPLKDLV